MARRRSDAGGKDPAGGAVRLVDAQGAGPGIAGVGEDVAHVVKEYEAERVAEEGQRRRRQAQLGPVDQRAGAADGVPGLRIAWSRPR